VHKSENVVKRISFIVLISLLASPAFSYEWIRFNDDGSFYGDCDAQLAPGTAFSGSRSGDGFTASTPRRSIYNLNRDIAIREACAPLSSRNQTRSFPRGTPYCFDVADAAELPERFSQSRAAFELFSSNIEPLNQLRLSRGEPIICNFMDAGTFTIIDQNLSGQTRWWLLTDNSGTRFYAFE
jgi:hypothetical protein